MRTGQEKTQKTVVTFLGQVSGSTKLSEKNVLTLKLSLLGVNSLGAGAFSSTCASGGGEGGGGVLGVQARTVTSVDLWPFELRALSSSP